MTVSRGRYFRQDFDRDRSFVATRAFTCVGQSYVPPAPIDKSLFTVRRLRQMYDMRMIGYDHAAEENSESPQELIDRVLAAEDKADPPQPQPVPRRRYTSPVEEEGETIKRRFARKTA